MHFSIERSAWLVTEAAKEYPRDEALLHFIALFEPSIQSDLCGIGPDELTLMQLDQYSSSPVTENGCFMGMLPKSRLSGCYFQELIV